MSRWRGWVARALAGAVALTCGAVLPVSAAEAKRSYVGFDRNDYPGDAALPLLRKEFSFAGYWLNNPPGAQRNGWQGKRELLVKAGFGFVVLVNGRVEAEIQRALGAGKGTAAKVTAAGLGERDAGAAILAARREGFPAGTVLFLDQEEGGRLLQDQADYVLGWTEGVARGGYEPGVYASGQAVGEGPGKTITTAADLRERVARGHLHRVAMWVYQDACPPANGCSLRPPRLEASGTEGAAVWQYAQSPRRKEITAACAKTYASDGNCYVPELPGVQLDLDVAGAPDPSRGR